mgnify:CR=1 FL=1
MKNFQSATFSLGLSAWIENNYIWNRGVPKLIQEWANRYFPNQWECVLDEANSVWSVTFKNIPKSSITMLLLTGSDLTLAETVEYKIHPEAVKLFDFGDQH